MIIKFRMKVLAEIETIEELENFIHERNLIKNFKNFNINDKNRVVQKINNTSEINYKHFRKDGFILEFIKTQSLYQKEYWIERGYHEECAEQKICDLQIKNSEKLAVKKLKNPKQYEDTLPSQLKYWIKKCDGDKKLAKEKLKAHQSTFTLEKCIKKHGEEKGIEVYKNRQNKWQRALYSNFKTEEEKTEFHKLRGKRKLETILNSENIKKNKQIKKQLKKQRDKLKKTKRKEKRIQIKKNKRLKTELELKEFVNIKINSKTKMSDLKTDDDCINFIVYKKEKKRLSDISKFGYRHKCLYNFILKQTDFLNNKTSYYPTTLQRIWHIINKTKEIPTCQECGKEIEFINKEMRYKKGCSIECSHGKISMNKFKNTCIERYNCEYPLENEIFKEKARQTTLKKFGVKHAMQSDVIKNKIKESNIKKYGVDHPRKNKEKNKEINNKREKTFLQKYGKKHPLQVEEFKKKAEEANLKRFGVKYSMQSKEVQDKSKAKKLELYGDETYSNREKFKKTMMDRYGVDNVFNMKGFREKSDAELMEKHGVKHYMHLPEIQLKVSNSRFKKKEYILPSKKVILLQGYENFTLDWLLNKFDEKEIIFDTVKIFDEIGRILYKNGDKTHMYYPDFYVKSINTIFETKSKYTFFQDFSENILKKEACLKIGLNFEFKIYNREGTLLSENPLIEEYYSQIGFA